MSADRPDPHTPDPGDQPTRIDRRPAAAAATPPSGTPAASGLPEEFGEEICPLRPGERCGGRYRMIEKIGAGGMGEVWKARDEAIDQVVALKFLGGPFLESEGRGVEVLRNEVRLARKVTHPNVCRVHDLGQVADKTFLSMEFIDGEPLDSLLKRVGRPAPEVCRKIARQLTAGLQAAHEQGVLHRDLKPANVMIDGNGDVRITDFGIAGIADEQDAAQGSSGTPGYMAPELFAGGTASIQSDLWSLGAVLHELFTGQRLMKAGSMTELLKKHRQPVEPPSRYVREVDAELDTLIVDLLARDPARRPKSALVVLGRLTGEDLLAEALRSGKTPSPELVAASTGSEKRCVRTVVGLFTLLLVSLAAAFWFEPHVKLVGQVELPESGPVLASMARRHLRALGVAEEDQRRAWGFDINTGLIGKLGRSEAQDRFAPIRDPGARTQAIDFWYRTSPDPLVPQHLSGVVTWSDPPFHDIGMVRLRLDPRGRLFELDVVPRALMPPREQGETQKPIPDKMPAAQPSPAEVLDAAFESAGLDRSEFRSVTPEFLPLVFADEREAWTNEPDEKETGADPNQQRKGPFVRLELARLQHEVVGLRVIEIQHRDLSGYVTERKGSGNSGPLEMLRALLLVLAVFMAFKAWKNGRADIVGARKLAFAVFGLVLLVTLLTGNHSADLGAEGRLWLRGMARALLVSIQYAIFYMALEPHVRRIWPETMVSWARLLQGRFTDRAVAYSVLGGVTLGTGCAALLMAARDSSRLLEASPTYPLVVRDRALEVLHGATHSVGAILEIVAYYADLGMALALGLVLLRYLLRSRWAAGIAMALLLCGGWMRMIPEFSWVALTTVGIASVLAVVVAVRIGLLALMIGLFTFRVVTAFPLRADLDHWLAGATILATALILGLGTLSTARMLKST